MGRCWVDVWKAEPLNLAAKPVRGQVAVPLGSVNQACIVYGVTPRETNDAGDRPLQHRPPWYYYRRADFLKDHGVKDD